MSDYVAAYTVNDLLTTYEQEYLPGKSARTHYQQKHLYKFLRAELGEVLLTDLTPTRLRQWRDALMARQYAAGTVRRYMDSLSAPLTIAARDYEWIPDNPMRKVKKPMEAPGRVRFLDAEERARLLAACKQSRNPHLYTLVQLALCTGARKSELLGLRWRDIDLQRGVLRLQRTKNKEKRALPVVGEVLERLRHQGQDGQPDAYVFARWGINAPAWIHEAWKTAVRRAKLQDFRFHDLRHTAASYLAMSGASLIDIATILGHKSIQVTKRYSHLSTGHVHDVVARMAQQFLTEAPDGPLELGIMCLGLWSLLWALLP